MPDARALRQATGAEPGKAAVATVQGVSVLAVLVDCALTRAPASGERGVLAYGFRAPVGVDYAHA